MAAEKIMMKDGHLHVPNEPVIPFIEGDGTGPDIWRASVRVMDAAVEKAYGGQRKIHWKERLHARLFICHRFSLSFFTARGAACP